MQWLTNLFRKKPVPLESTFDAAPVIPSKPVWQMGANEMRRHYGYPDLYEDGQTQVEPVSAGFQITYVYRAATDRLEILERKAMTDEAREAERMNKMIAEHDRLANAPTDDEASEAAKPQHTSWEAADCKHTNNQASSDCGGE